MVRSSPARTSFNAGKLGGSMLGRVDWEKYSSGCEVLQNAIPMRQGGVKSRMGTYYVSEVKTSTDQTWLIPFVFSVDAAYVLEFGDQYIRFYNNHLQIGGGPAYEVATPYTAADLTASDGTCALDYVQSGDVMYITCPGHKPRVLTRTTSSSWTLSEYEFKGGPFLGVDPDETITVYASAQTGSVTLTASSSVFNANHVGELFLLEDSTTSSYDQWEPSKSVTANDLIRSEGNVYKAITTGTTGTIKPVHTVGRAKDGSSGVTWEYQHSGYGWVEITSYSSGTSVGATVKSLLPSNVVGSGNATTRWSHSVWSADTGWPTHCCFYKERLVFAGGVLASFSVPGDFEDNSQRTAGQINPDNGFYLYVLSDTANTITWVAPSKDLLIGTVGGEHYISPSSVADPFGPDNAVSQPVPFSYGGRHVSPILSNGGTLYVHRSGTSLREAIYSFDTDSYRSDDISIHADDVPDGKITQMAFQRLPDNVIWMACEDGGLIGCTYYPEQNVIAWHEHPLSDGIVESVATIPDPTNTQDELWLIIKLTVDGNTKRYVCYMKKQWRLSDGLDEIFYLDCGLTYDGTATSTITGLSHLEGKTVSVVADGAAHPDRTVSSGEIELQADAEKVHIGLSFLPRIKPTRMEGGAQTGTSQGKMKRSPTMVMRFHETGGEMRYGQDTSVMDEVLFRSTADAMDEPVPIFTGDKRVTMPSYWTRDGYIVIEQRKPFPFTLLGLYPILHVSDSY